MGISAVGALFRLLRNRIYVGQIVHKDKIYPGAQAAIIDTDVFDAVQDKLNDNARRHASGGNGVAPAPLRGRISDASGRAMSPTFSYNGRGRLYRYYIPAALQQGRCEQLETNCVRRIAAVPFEQRLAEIVERVAGVPRCDALSVLTRVEIHPHDVQLLMSINYLARVREQLMGGECCTQDASDSSQTATNRSNPTSHAGRSHVGPTIGSRRSALGSHTHSRAPTGACHDRTRIRPVNQLSMRHPNHPIGGD